MAAPEMVTRPQTQKILILAQDPAVLAGTPLFTEVDVPFETPREGPWGYRVRVIDYDSSTGKLYKPAKSLLRMPANASEILEDPAFHAQNVYAIVMRTLARFEFALGRRVNWSFDGHQLFVAPHAFADANAFYSKWHRGLFFGYFTGTSGETVFTCLSHDVIAHETTHALLDGLRERFTDLSSPQQGGLHEAAGDIVALLSIFSLKGVVERCLDLNATGGNGAGKLVAKAWLTPDNLKDSVLFGLGEQMGQQLAPEQLENKRADALRRSVRLDPDMQILQRKEFQEPHRCGEVLVAAMMNAFLSIWGARIAQLGTVSGNDMDRSRVAEDGRIAADHLLTIAIRAFDYTPATDICFSDYLSALLTADYEVQPNDEQYGYREILRESFAAYGIKPASARNKEGLWEPPGGGLDYSCTHFESMQRDRDEVFRFMWENRKPLEINEDAYTRVLSIRPCTRVSSDGFTLRETIGQYVQMITLKAGELDALDWEISSDLSAARKRELDPFPKPKGMPDDKEITIYGGGTLIFDEYGRLKYHVRNKILNADRQAARLQFLWDSGALDQKEISAMHFANIHRLRWTNDPVYSSTREVHHDDYF